MGSSTSVFEEEKEIFNTGSADTWDLEVGGANMSCATKFIYISWHSFLDTKIHFFCQESSDKEKRGASSIAVGIDLRYISYG